MRTNSQTQARTESADDRRDNVVNINQVRDVKARDEFICAVLVYEGLTPLELKVVVRLAIFLNCTTGQCNPGYLTLARSVDAKPDSVKKVCRKLEAAGLIYRKRSAGGVHSDKTGFVLLMPRRVSSPDSCGDPATGVPAGRPRVSTADSQENTEKENTERERAREEGFPDGTLGKLCVTDWHLAPGDIAYAHEKKWDAAAEFEKFSDHHIAKRTTATPDGWPAYWRGWIRRCDQYGGAKYVPEPKTPEEAKEARRQQAIEQMRGHFA
jgi:DNA-binding MarR family transcriptional regulator